MAENPTRPYGMVEPPQTVSDTAVWNRPANPVNPPRYGYNTRDWTRESAPTFPWQGAKMQPSDTAQAVVVAEHERDRLFRMRLMVQAKLELAEDALTAAQGRHRTAVAEQTEAVTEHGFTIGGDA